MKTTLLAIGGFLAAILLALVLFGLSFGFEVLGIKKEGVTQPMREDVRREVFEGTRSYNEGKEQQLAKYRLEWMKGDAATKAALEATIQASFANFDKNKLNSFELMQFLTQVRGY